VCQSLVSGLGSEAIDFFGKEKVLLVRIIATLKKTLADFFASEQKEKEIMMNEMYAVNSIAFFFQSQLY
jgi:hypothetical protein